MAVSRRSPNYPSIDLGAAIAAVRIVFEAQRCRAMPRARLAQHLDQSALSGRALEKIAGVRAYGLVEAVGQEMRVSDDMATILEAPNTVERQIALTRCAYYSTIYRQIAAWQGSGELNQSALRFWLSEKGFRPKAIEKLISNYLATIKILENGGGGYHLLAGWQEAPAAVTASIGQRREIITLPEGDVTIIFPGSISISSYQDLTAFLKLFLKKTRRNAVMPERD